LVFNSKGELLIQKRAKKKYHCGGIWANTVCSHPRLGESYEQATHRRLKEEFGFDCNLKKTFSFIYRQEFDNGLTEHEHDTIFVGEYNGEPVPNPEEIEDYRWISLNDLRDEIGRNEDQFAVWLKIILEKLD
jgi:isopentenyl-diphosphate Delta-isomerase